MKIILCHNYYKLPGGEDQVFFDEGWLLEKHGHTVVRFEKQNSDIDRMNRLQVARSTIWNSNVGREIGELIDREQPDVIHFHNTFPLISPAAYSAAKRRGVPVIQSLHNFRMVCPGSTLLRNGKICEKCVRKRFAWPSIVHGCYRNSKSGTAVVALANLIHHLGGAWKNNVDIFVALTEHSRDVFIKAGVPKSKIVVKPNFVYPDPGQRTEEGDFAVFAGRLSAEKGIDVLLDAWQNEGCNLPLKIFGDGPKADDVRNAAQTHEKIEWMGQVPFETVLSTLREARLLIMPSVWYETFGRTTIEAFAAGVPVVASNIGAMKEIVSDGSNGLHFEMGSAKDLATNVNYLATDDLVRHRLGRQAREDFLRLYSAETNYTQLINIYEYAANGNCRIPSFQT